MKKKYVVIFILLLVVLAFIFAFLRCSSEKTFSEIIISDYSDCFDKINGCAVFYDFNENKYYVYNENECNKRYSPYSIFKIVSSLEGLKYGVVTDENSQMSYSGKEYPFDTWNKELGFKEAFQVSCVWYFRQLTDKVGMEKFSEDVKNLNYGNCDVSEWNGSGVNPDDELNGFWLGSSLEISPIEAARVVSDIFEGKTDYEYEHINILKDIMKSEYPNMYGKTGTGMDNTAWYNGFYEKDNKRIYFAIHLNNGDNENVAGSNAKEITYKIIEKYFS